MDCPKCDFEIEPSWIFCPFCGNENSTPNADFKEKIRTFFTFLEIQNIVLKHQRGKLESWSSDQVGALYSLFTELICDNASSGFIPPFSVLVEKEQGAKTWGEFRDDHISLGGKFNDKIHNIEYHWGFSGGMITEYDIDGFVDFGRLRKECFDSCEWIDIMVEGELFRIIRAEKTILHGANIEEGFGKGLPVKEMASFSEITS